MKNILLALTICFILTLGAYAQCDTGSVCVRQSTVDRCAEIADELITARDTIAKFTTERVSSLAEREAAQKVIAGLNQLVAVKDRIEVEQQKIIELYKSVVDMQAALVEKLTTQLNKPKSAWAKFLDVLKSTAILLAGITLGRGL
jgi:uncharacterized coiled-coil protein SlyX